jgi:hypothetical protein
MLSTFKDLNANFNGLSVLKLHRYGFVIYTPKKLPLREINNIKSIIHKFGGCVSFFTPTTAIYVNTAVTFKNYLVITFPYFEFSFTFPYYLNTIFSNFNFFPFYFKLGFNFIPLNSNFLFNSVNKLINDSTTLSLPVNIKLLLDVNRRRLFILFKFFFNSYNILHYKKTCQH